jgi:hypothetical protein
MGKINDAKLVVRALRVAPVRSIKCMSWIAVSVAANRLTEVADRASDRLAELDNHAYRRARELDYPANDLSRAPGE